MRKRDLEAALEQVAEFDAPVPALEQYRTPPGVAADFLWEANDDGAIKGKHVVDLGCGTGMLSLAATLLGATVTGVDVDGAVVALAQEMVPDGTFVTSQLEDWEPVQADTVIMNPPFGAQNKGADRIFYEKAIATGASTIWFLAQPNTEKFLNAMARGAGKSLEKVATWSYPIAATMDHHAEAVRQVRVCGYRLG